MYRTFFIESDAAVEVARGAKQVKSRLSVVTFVCAVDIGLGEDEDQSAEAIPLDLGLFCLEECLLAGRWGAQVEQRIYANARWLTLLFWYEDSN